jgi:hypothetical protein
LLQQSSPEAPRQGSAARALVPVLSGDPSLADVVFDRDRRSSSFAIARFRSSGGSFSIRYSFFSMRARILSR